MFQQVVNAQPAQAIEGDFASSNPRSSMLTSAGGLVAGPLGVTVGRFAWADNDGVVRNIGGGGNGRIGFVHRDNVALITQWLGRSTMIVVPGYEINLMSSGDFWARFAAGATPGQKVYANYADGSCYAAATATPPAAGAVTGSIAAGAASFTASIAPANPFNLDEEGGIMTVTTAPTGSPGVIQPGGVLSGTNVVSGQTVLSQLSGTAGGVGTYEVSIAQTLASEAITQAYGVFTAASGLTGTFAVGDTLTGGSGATQITALGTGTGGLGTYIVNNATVVSSTSFTSAGAIETAWYVDTYAAAGELAKISPH
jgi:hypothetical protein